MDIDGSPYRVVVHTVDKWRIYFNHNFDHLEPWQIVLYTISWTLFIQWMRKIFKYEEGFTFNKAVNDLLLNILPFVRKKYDENKDTLLKKLDEKMLKFDQRKEFYKFLPDRGLMPSDIIGEAADYRAMSDLLFERGRMSGSNFADTEDNLMNLLKEVFPLYCFSNSAYPDIFPAIRKMEAEIVRMMCSLYHGGPKSCGTFTTSDSESILLVCNAYRNRAFKAGIRKPEIIVAENAGIGFWEAGKTLGIRIVKLPLTRVYEADIGAIKRAINRETCLIVVSTPSPVTGTMDPIEEISQLAVHYGVPLHVDASWGGFLLPFMEQCDFPALPFDFRVSGVSSLTVDLDKYAYCPNGSSVIVYRDPELLEFQCSSETDWPGGVYVSPTLTDNRSGSLIALTWSTLLYHGRHGYVEKTQLILDATQFLAQCIKKEFDGVLQLLGEPSTSIIAFTTTSHSKIPAHWLGDELNELGWNLTLLQYPEALRVCITLNQTKDNVIQEFIEDIKKCVKKIQDAMADPDTKAWEATTPLFGFSSPLPDYNISFLLPKLVLSTYYSTPAAQVRSMRTLSIEGRKLSQMISASRLASFSFHNAPLKPPKESNQE
uniref:Glutamate decarboxylase n=1 Tax=Panagrolaimus sp. PS1159 TaxID=55785 RepID=A0AC35G5K7_9BILA